MGCPGPAPVRRGTFAALERSTRIWFCNQPPDRSRPRRPRRAIQSTQAVMRLSGAKVPPSRRNATIGRRASLAGAQARPSSGGMVRRAHRSSPERRRVAASKSEGRRQAAHASLFRPQDLHHADDATRGTGRRAPPRRSPSASSWASTTSSSRRRRVALDIAAGRHVTVDARTPPSRAEGPRARPPHGRRSNRWRTWFLTRQIRQRRRRARPQREAGSLIRIVRSRSVP